MFKKLLMLSILSSAILSHCSEGCLRCDLQNNRCQFCDIQRGFKTVRGECMKVYSENCAIFNFEGFCIHCEKGYFLDTYAMSCVQVPELGLVNNCDTYSADNICHKCKSGYHLQYDNTCIQITNPINNCKVYRSPDLCEFCQNGFQISFDFKSCEKPTQISNCVAYSKLQCQSCKSGYKINPNNYLQILYGFKNTNSIRQIQNKFILESQDNLLPAFDTCQKLDINNCMVYSSSNECAKCMPNFFLKQNQCIPYPKERILNCLKYKSLTECIQCEEGMHRKSEIECVLNDKVDNCITYDATALQTTCQQCAVTHYLSEFNVCTLRTNVSEIGNCVIISNTNETCEKCVETFTLTNDKKKCLQRVLNCKVHEDSDATTQQLTCRICDEGFYYDIESQSCKEGNISKCVRYSRTSNSCEECENRYYLAGGLCRTHDDLVYCDIYNNQKKNSCSVCYDRTVLMFRLNTCLPVTYINKCSVYETQTTCKVCEDGYELNNIKQCSQIPGNEFCLQKQNNKCIKCLESYVLQNGTCQLPLAHITRNCASYNVNGLLSYSELTCNYCNENSIPMNYKETFTCYEEDYLKNQLDIDTSDKCQKYKEVNGKYQCVGCIKEYLLLDGECIEGPFCPDTHTLRLQVIQQLDVDSDGVFDSFYVEKINECGPKINNCKVAAPDLLQDQTNVRYSCITCDDDKISVVEFSDKQVLMRPPRFEGDQMFSPLNQTSSKICKDPTMENIIGLVNDDNNIKDCQLYQNLTGFGLGCQKCKHGMTGRVYDLIHKCTKYSSLTTCTQCADGFHPIKPYQCVRVKPVQYCIKYDGSDSQTNGQCKECEKDFYIKDKECVKRDTFVKDCQKYEHMSQQCEECKEGFFLMNDKCSKKIFKCEKYSDENTCSLCQEQHYLMNNLCYKGADEQCKVYDQGVGKINKCKICYDQYYLKDNKCYQFTTAITNCNQHSQEHGYCVKCDPGYLLFHMQKKCRQVLTVNNCKEYNTRESCKVCNDGYYPVNYGLRCLVIPDTKNCSIWGPLTPGNNYDEDNCLKCKTNDYLLINKKCRSWFKALSMNCQQPDETMNGTQSFYKCKYCNANMTPMDINTQGLCLEKDIFDSYPDVVTIPKCIRYKMADGSLKCLQCENNYYIKNSTQCVTLEQCISTTGYFVTKLEVDTTANNTTTIKQGPSCINSGADQFAAISNCIYQPVMIANFLAGTQGYKYGCVECLNGYLPYIDLSNTTKRLAYTLTDDNINSTIPVYDDCLKASDLTLQGTTNSNNQIENCAVYSKYTDNGASSDHFCLACKKNYQGKVKPGQTPADHNTLSELNSYIDQCVAFSGCSSNNIDSQSLIPSTYQYLSAAYLNVFDMGLLFSGCNKCDGNLEILAAFVNIDIQAGNNYTKITGLGAIKTYSTTPTKTNVFADADGVSLDCLSVSSGNYVLGSLSLPEVANCQKIIVNANSLSTNGATHGAPTTLDYACVQCQPGYRAVRALDIDANHKGQEIIKECVLITNCKTALVDAIQPNICQECQDNYAFKYDTTRNEVLLDTCISTNKTNCYSASDSECKICKQGYILNDTNDCVKAQPPKCQIYNPNFDTNLNKNFVRYSMKLMKNAAGCVKCDTDYIPIQNANDYLQAIQFEQVKKVCVDNSNYQAITTTIDQCQTDYLRQNLRTEYNSNVILRVDCIMCNTDFIQTQDGKCISKSNNANCLLVESINNNYCVKCEQNYLSIAGVCKQDSVLDANCDQFADMSFRTGALCKKCKDGYYLVTEVIDSITTTTCQQYTLNEIQNCAQFDSTDLNRLFCVKCNTNYALMILSGDEINGKEGYNRTCLNVTGKVQDECAEFSISGQSNGQFICKKCNANFVLEDIDTNQNVCVNTLTNVQNCAEIDINDQLEQQYQGITFKRNYFPRLSTLKCKKCTDDYFLQTNTNSCTQRTKTNNNTYGNQCHQFEPLDDFCKVCKENYFLSGDKSQCVPAPNMTHSQGSLFSCTDMFECKSDIYRNGLNPHIDSLLSCHQCKENDQIPFIVINGQMPYTTIKGINQYDLQSGQNKFTDLIGGKSNLCMKPQANSFNIDNDKFNFPTNCSIGALNVDTGNVLDATNANVTTNVDLNKIQVFCVACQPGFKFVPATDANSNVVPYMAGQCQEITNCKYSNAFNNCTECKTGFGFEYKNNQVQYDSCVAVTNNEDCYAQDTVNNKCKFCCKGTYLNKDGVCERVTPPKCDYNQYIHKQVYKFKDLNTGLYLSAQGTGCNQCNKEYFALYRPQNHFVCTESQQHYDNKLNNDTEYIKNCVHYFEQNEALKCKKCKTGYVPISQEGICTQINTGLQNCLFALSSVHCEICEDDYVLVDRACQKKKIDKCYKYKYNLESHKQVCIDCMEGYYLEANTCLPGNVKNCLLYETNTVCNKCNPGFHLVKRNDGVSYCYPIDKKLNCAKFDSNEFQKGRLQCTECVNNQFIISTDYEQYYSTHCLKFFETPNCVKYDIKPAIADSSFSCLECTSNFFLDNQNCQVRTVQPLNCIDYNRTQDICSQCSEGYFVSQDGTTCLPYPVGTPNCRLYTDETTCVSCMDNYYLQNNLCVEILEDLRVENCQYYVGPKLCDQCLNGYLNVDGSCKKIQAQNCATTESLIACASCPKGYGFVEENSIKSCIQQSITDCVDFDPNPPYKCLQCQNKFFVDSEGKCIAVVNEIPNCLVYAEEGICQRCESFSALSQDRTKCLLNRIVLEQLDQNCQESQILESYQCRACQDGYVFVEDKCQQCELQKNPNCKACHPFNLNQCLICKSGYFMNKDGICDKFVPPQLDVDNYLNPTPEEPTTNPNDTQKSTLKLTIFTFMMVVINILF